MKCYICSKPINEGYLCKEHAQNLKKLLNEHIGVIDLPEWKHHCHLCGEYKDRKIIKYENWGYFCDKDINEEWNRYFSN